MSQIANALVFIHEREEIHRSLKTANGFISECTRSNRSVLHSRKDDAWKLADSALTSDYTMHARGTPGYRAAEVMALAPYDDKVDISAWPCDFS